MYLPELNQRLNKKKISLFQPGSIDNIFDYYQKCSRDASGKLYEFIKPDPVEEKKKKSIN